MTFCTCLFPEHITRLCSLEIYFHILVFFIGSQDDPRLFLRPWCMERQCSSMSNTSNMHGKARISLEPGPWASCNFWPWGSTSFLQRTMVNWLTVPWPLCVQSVTHLRYHVSLFVHDRLISSLMTSYHCMIASFWLSLIFSYKLYISCCTSQ